MRQYLDLLDDLLRDGEPRKDRTGVGTLGVFGRQLRFDLQQSFPLLTTKRLHLRSIIHELLWFLRGDTDIGYLQRAGVSIWDEWADADGELGPVYGKQWRRWSTPEGERDQIAAVIESLRAEPESRRHVVCAWNVADLPRMALAPCHVLFQFHVSERGLSCQVYQRSADVFLGLPFNIASYALLTRMVAQVIDRPASELVYTLGDVHLYRNHVEQAKTQLAREPGPPPVMRLNERRRDIDEFSCEDFELSGYAPHPAIPAPVAV